MGIGALATENQECTYNCKKVINFFAEKGLYATTGISLLFSKTGSVRITYLLYQ